MKKLAKKFTAILVILSCMLTFCGCEPLGPWGNEPVEITNEMLDDVITRIQNESITTSTELFYSQFTQTQAQSPTYVASTKQSAPLNETANGSDPSVYDIDGNKYTISDGKMIVEYQNGQKQSNELSGLPCSVFDNTVNQYKTDISNACENSKNSEYPICYANDAQMHQIVIEISDDEVLYKYYDGEYEYNGEWAMTDYYYYHSYVDKTGDKIIDAADLHIYSETRIDKLKMDGTDNFKGGAIHVVDGKTYQFKMFGQDKYSIDQMSVDITRTENGVEMTSNSSRKVYSEETGEEISHNYSIEKYKKNNDTTFASVGRSEFVDEKDRTLQTIDTFTLYNYDNSLLWGADGTNCNISDIGVDKIQLALNPHYVDPEFAGVYFNSGTLKELKVLQKLAMTEEERNEVIDLSTAKIDYEKIPTYLSYLSYIDNLTGNAEHETVLAGLKGIQKELEPLKSFDYSRVAKEAEHYRWSNTPEKEAFNSLLNYYDTFACFTNDYAYGGHSSSFEYLYYLKYLVNLENIDTDYVNQNSDVLQDFATSIFSLWNSEHIRGLFETGIDTLFETYLSDIHWHNFFGERLKYGTDVTFFNGDTAIDFDGLVRVNPPMFTPYFQMSEYTENMRRNDFDKLVECRDNKLIPTLDFDIKIFNVGDDLADKFIEVFDKNGLTFKGYEAREVIDLYNQSKTTLTIDLEADFFEEEFEKAIPFVLNNFENFIIDNVKNIKKD